MTKWKHTLRIGDIWESLDSKTMPIKDGAKAISKRLLLLRIRDEIARDDQEMLCDELASIDDVEEFDAVLSNIYDWADDNRVWIDRFPRRK